jgi:hypothetical protein
VLFVIHDIIRGADLEIDDTDGRRLGSFALAILGAPIWLRDAPASAFLPDDRGSRQYQLGVGPKPGVQSVAPTYVWDEVTQRDIWSTAPASGYSAQWLVWDDIASHYADLLARRSQLGISGDYVADQVDRLITTQSSWEDLCRWFADQAQSFGGAAIQLHVHPRRRILRWLYDNNAYVPSGRFGRLITSSRSSVWQDTTALILTDGALVLASEHGFVYEDGDVSPVDVSRSSKWAVAMLAEAAHWRAFPVE